MSRSSILINDISCKALSVVVSLRLMLTTSSNIVTADLKSLLCLAIRPLKYSASQLFGLMVSIYVTAGYFIDVRHGCVEVFHFDEANHSFETYDFHEMLFLTDDDAVVVDRPSVVSTRSVAVGQSDVTAELVGVDLDRLAEVLLRLG